MIDYVVTLVVGVWHPGDRLLRSWRRWSPWQRWKQPALKIGYGARRPGGRYRHRQRTMPPSPLQRA